MHLGAQAPRQGRVAVPYQSTVLRRRADPVLALRAEGRTEGLGLICVDHERVLGLRLRERAGHADSLVVESRIAVRPQYRSIGVGHGVPEHLLVLLHERRRHRLDVVRLEAHVVHLGRCRATARQPRLLVRAGLPLGDEEPVQLGVNRSIEVLRGCGRLARPLALGEGRVQIDDDGGSDMHDRDPVTDLREGYVACGVGWRDAERTEGSEDNRDDERRDRLEDVLHGLPPKAIIVGETERY